MSKSNNNSGAVLPTLMQLEQRLMFDGAAVEASVDTLAGYVADQQVVEAADDMFSLAVAHGQTQQASEKAQEQIKDYFENASAEELFQLFNGGKDTLDAQWLQSMEALRQSVLSDDYQVRVEFLDNDTTKGVLGAFAAEGKDGEPTIYLNRDWVEGIAGEQDIVKVLVEELGHSIDSLVNAGADTAGDEGEGFAAAVLNQSTATDHSSQPLWQTDNDHYVIEVDGEQVEVEAATLNFVNAYEMVYDLDNDNSVDNNERWAEKEQNSHYFNTASLGEVTVDDDVNSRYFSGNDVSAIGINIGGETYYGWISRPIKAGGVVRGFYFWTDTNFTDLQTAQNDGNTDGDRDVTDNRGFLLVVDQTWFDQQITGSSEYTINNTKDGNVGTIQVANIGSSSDRVDTALNSFVVDNSNPDAANDTLTVDEDSGTTTVSAATGLLSNDTDADLDSLTVTNFTVGGSTVTVDPTSGGSHSIPDVGDITINADGSYAFTPVADYNGSVPPITYSVSDGNGGTATAVLSIQVTPVNDVPVGSDDHIITSENTPKVLGLDDFGTYSDPENDPLSTIQITQLASAGVLQYWDGANWAVVTLGQEITVAQLLQGQIRFTPNTNESGLNYATIQFKVSDGQDYSVDAYTLSVEVTAGNQAPIANADTNEVSEEGCEVAAADATGNVLTDGTPDSDPENQQLTVSAVTFNGNTLVVSGPTTIQGQYGTLAIDTDGEYSYTLDNSLADIDAMNSGDEKFDVFSYTVTDGTDSSTSTLSLTINGTNDAPVAVDDAGTFIEGDNAGAGNFGTVTGDALANDSDVDDADSSLEVVLNGTTPSGGADVVLDASSPISSVTLTVADSGGDGWTATVPTSGQTPVWTDAGLSVPARDAAGNQLTVVRSGSGANATLVFSDNVALYDYQNINLYIADANKTAIVQVTITSATTTASTTIYSNDDVSGVQAGYLVSGTDKNGQPLNGVTVVSVDPASKTITLNTAVEVNNASFTFQDPNSITLADTETYFAGTYGYLIINESGAYTYTLTTDLAAEQVVTEQFIYTTKDAANCTDTAVITIRATGVDAPKLANDTLVVSEDTGAHVTFNGNAGNDLTDALVTNDADGTIITLGDVKEFQVVGDASVYTAGSTATISGVGELTITADGKVTFDPVDNYLGPVPTVTYTRTGSDSQDYDALLTITIQSADDASVLVEDSNSVPEETTATGNVLANDSDVDSVLTVGSFSFTSNGSTVSYPAGEVAQEVRDGSNNLIGTIVLESNGSYSFVPVANWNGSVPQITYITNTGVTSTLDITVTPVNDAPLLDLDADDSSVSGSDFSSSYTIGTTGVSIADADALITDVDDTNIESAVIVLENAQLGDDLTVGSLPGGMTASAPVAIDGKLTITLSGSATLANYQAAIQAITFSSDSQFTMDRVISVKVNDGDIDSNTAYTTLTIAPDARALSVTGTTVNEASPYVQFQVSGVTGQWVSLSLSETNNGSDATMGIDFLPNLQYFNGTDWVDYTGGMIQIPSGDGTLLVRTPVLQDSINEGAETLQLTATNQAGVSDVNTSTIIDDGTGSVFLGNNKTSTPNGENDTDPDGPNYPEYLDDDRPVTVNSIVVNEASPWAMFTVTGNDGQALALGLHDGTATKGEGILTDGSEDYGTGIEYWDGSTWAVYNGASVTMSGGTLLVRTAIHQDSLFEGQHSFSLGVTKLSSGTTAYGIADIYDDGTGKTYTFDDPNDGTPDIAEGPGIGFDDDRTLIIDNPVVNEASDYAVFTLTGNSGQTASLQLIDESNNGTELGKANIDEVQILKVWDGLDWVDYNPDHLPTFDGDDKIYVRVDIRAEQDADFENSETFKLNATLTGQSSTVTGTATIKDDGAGVIYPETPADPQSPNGNTPGTDDDRPTNTAPASTDDRVETNEDTPVVLSLTDFGTFTDPENDSLEAIEITQLPSKGVLEYNSAAGGDPDNWVAVSANQEFNVSDITGGKLRYVPVANESGNAYTTLQFKVSDGELYSANAYTLTVDVIPVNDAPVAVDDTASTAEDTVLTSTVDLDANDTDLDGDSLTVVPGTFPTTQGGTIVIASDGSYTYTPPANFNGTDTVTYTVTDGNLTDEGTLTITVTPVNDPPVLVDGNGDPLGDDQSVTTPEDTPVSGQLVANDPDGDDLTFSKATDPTSGSVTVNPDGSWEYTPNPSYSGNDSFTVTVSDGKGGSDTLTVNVEVTPKPVVVPPPAPVAPAPSADVPPPPPPVEIPPMPRVETGIEQAQVPETGQILVQRDIPEQTFASSNGITLISFNIPTDTFGHTEPGAEITLSAVLADGRELPDWLLFDPEKGEFRGVAPKGFDGTLVIRVIARDQDGNQVETMVTIQVRSEQAETAELMQEGKGGLMQQLQSHNQFAWKAERDRLIHLARAAVEERSGNAS